MHCGPHYARRNDSPTGHVTCGRRDTRDQRPTRSTSIRQPIATNAGKFICAFICPYIFLFIYMANARTVYFYCVTIKVAFHARAHILFVADTQSQCMYKLRVGICIFCQVARRNDKVHTVRPI